MKEYEYTKLSDKKSIRIAIDILKNLFDDYDCNDIKEAIKLLDSVMLKIQIDIDED